MLRYDGIPLYHQLKEIFQEKISSGEWPPGATIPTEGQLCAEYGVSRGPVRQALDRLAREGLLARKQGRGTWVRAEKMEGSLGRLYSFAELIEQQGLVPSSHVLTFEKAAATTSVARDLALQPGEFVYRVVRVRFASDEPLIVETIFLPVSRVPEMERDEVEQKPLYSILRSEFHIPLLRARQYFEAVIADTWEAGLLQVKPGAPVLLLRNIAYTTGDVPVVLSRVIVRGDRLRYYVDHSSEPGDSQSTELATP